MNKYSEERKLLQAEGLVPMWWTTAGYQLFVEKYQWAATPLLQYRKIAQTAARHIEDMWPKGVNRMDRRKGFWSNNLHDWIQNRALLSME